MSWLHSFKMSWFNVFQNDCDGLVKSRKSLFWGNAFAAFGSNITAGTFYTALLLVLFRGHPESLRNEYIGRIAMLQTAAGFLQMVAPLFIERMKRRKLFVMCLRWTYHVLNIFGLALIPILPLDIHVRANLFMIVAALMSATVALYSPGMSAWHIHPLSEHCRSDYYTINSLLAGALSLASNLLASVFMDFFAADGKEYTAILIMRGVAILLIALETKQFWQIKEPEYRVTEKKPSFVQILTIPFHYPRFLLNVLIAALWTGSTALVGSYYSTYLLADAKMSYTFLGVIGIVGIPFSWLATPIWNQIIHRHGWFRPMAISLVLYGGAYAINGFVTEETQWLYLLGSIYCTMGSPGSTLAFSNLPYMNSPKEGLSSCLAFYSTVGSLMGFLGAWLGKNFIHATEGKIIEIFGLQLKNAAYISFLPFFGSILIAGLILVVHRIDQKQKLKEQKEEEASVTA